MSDPYRAIRAKIERDQRLTSNERKLAADMTAQDIKDGRISGRDGRAIISGIMSGGRAPAPLRDTAAGRGGRGGRAQAAIQGGGRISGRAASRAASGGVGGSWQGANADLDIYR